MPTLNIEGRKIRVDDSFLQLSPEQQNATVEEIAKSLGSAQPAEAAPAQPSEAAAAVPSSAAAVPQEAPAAPEPAPTTSNPGVLQRIREAVHAPTRILENGILLGLGDRARAGMDAIIGNGSYGDNLKREQAETASYERDHPAAAIASGLVGGAVAPIGAIGAASKGAGIVAKSLLGAGAGGAIGAVQGGLSSKDWTDIPQTAKDAAIGGGFGGLIGATLPGAGQAVGWGVRSVADALRGRADGMTRAATGHLARAIEADGGIPAVRAELDRLGPEAMLLDAGQSLKGVAQGANLLAPEARALTSARLQARDDLTNTRIRDDVDRILGPGEDAATATKNILDYRSMVDGINYPRVLERVRSVKTAPILTELDDAIHQSVDLEQKALTNLRKMLVVEEMRPRIDPWTGKQALNSNGDLAFDKVYVSQNDPTVLHKAKVALDGLIEHQAPALGVPQGGLQNQQHALKHFRFLLNEALENQVPGYAQANAVSSRLARRADAVKTGTGYLGDQKTTPSPGRFLDEFEQLEAGERIALNKGSRAEIERLIGTKANNLVGLRDALRGEGSWNAQKLATVHGEEATRDLLDTVDRNALFRESFNDIVRNSQTAQRLSAKEALDPTVLKPGDVFSPNSTLAGMLTTGLKLGANKIGAVAAGEHRIRAGSELARILSEQGAEREKAVKAIADAMRRRGQNVNVSRGTVDAGLLAAASAANVLADDLRRKRW
ncbi:hypothetical protein [Rhodopseudomonas sp. BR0G17]|uniref:hypothetical protein n=1 Tax=Rhodopseudomonas sp. BR0G17 TaxID=2269368 RepID=UPI0013E08268|nr:hypothetical protein [Rhodopseudomonas sp. BR0G17]NEW95499.1 hypothetical protein [Rhodopseudomonas sp. BR0G17]